jgi:protein SCO1
MILALLLTVFSFQTLPDIRVTCRNEEKPLTKVLGESPALLTFVFARCVGMCSPLVRSLNKSIESTGGMDGYNVVVLSFDPRDTANDMDRLKRRLAVSPESKWSFCVAAKTDIQRITRAARFDSEWDAERMQFEHPAMVAALDQRGKIIRTINGLPIDPAEFNSLIRELQGEFVPVYPLPQKTLLSCIRFDARKMKVHLNWGFAVLFVPSVFTVLMIFVLFKAAQRRS